MAINILDKKKIEDEIKDLNSTRATYHRDFKEYEIKNLEKKISDKAFEKYKKKYNKRIEKIKIKILKLEKKLEKGI